MTDKANKTIELSEEQKAKDFIGCYEALCKQHGYHIIVNPAFKAMADTGTFNVVLQSSVGKLPKEEK